MNNIILNLIPSWAKAQAETRLMAGQTLPRGLLALVALTTPEGVVVLPEGNKALVRAAARYQAPLAVTAAVAPVATAVVAEPAPAPAVAAPAEPAVAAASAGQSGLQAKLAAKAAEQATRKVAFSIAVKGETVELFAVRNGKKFAKTAPALKGEGGKVDLAASIAAVIDKTPAGVIEVALGDYLIGASSSIDGIVLKTPSALRPMGNGTDADYPVCGRQALVISSLPNGGIETVLMTKDGQLVAKRVFAPKGSGQSYGSWLYAISCSIHTPNLGTVVEIYDSNPSRIENMIRAREVLAVAEGKGAGFTVPLKNILTIVDGRGVTLEKGFGPAPVLLKEQRQQAKEEAAEIAVASVGQSSAPRLSAVEKRLAAAKAKAKAAASPAIPASAAPVVAEVVTEEAVVEVVAPVVAAPAAAAGVVIDLTADFDF